MMNKSSFLFLAAMLLTAPALIGQVTSTFDTDADGWTAAHTGGTAATFGHQATGGNPGGFVSASPPTSGGSVNTSFTWYWNAPAKFFGDFDFSYGSRIKMDLQQSTAGTDNSQSDVIIYSGSNSLHFNFPTKPAVSPAWSSYSIPLDETGGWRWNGGSLAVKAQIKIVLANITGIRIRCKYINTTGYTSGIDNVSVEKRSLQTSPVITSFSPTSALPDETVTINGTDFGSSIPSNVVYFGNVRAAVLSASSTQLTVQVPASATMDPITVINTTNSLAAVSSADFIPKPLADPDLIGHIIPNSFATNVIIPYGDFNDNGLAGAEMGDIDGDGALDIVAFEDGQDKFAIFLNKKQDGLLTATSFASKVEIPSGELGQLNSSGTILQDFDNDGKLDIATYFRGNNPSLAGGFAVSRNISTPGNVQFETAEQFYNIGIFSSGLDVSDLDGDGLVDLLINSSGLYYARNISFPGNIEFATLRFLNSSGGAVSTKDLNGDNKPEIMVVGTGFNLLENTSTPGLIQFAAPVNFPGSAVSGITMADLDRDAKPDIVYYRINGFNDYDLVVKKNIHTTGALTTASFDADVLVSKVNRAYSQRVADVNGDGLPDILIGLNSGSTGYGFGVFENKTQPGTLNAASFFPLVEFEETSIGVFAFPLVGDLNGDYLPDVVGFASSDGGEHALILYANLTMAPPKISVNTVSPLIAPVGSTVTITGSRFSPDPAKNTVWFGAVRAQVLTADRNTLTVKVPAGASYDRVSVTRDFKTSRYHLPFATSFSFGATFDGTTFGAPVSFPVTGADYDVEAADLNGDGKPELIAESRVVTGIIRNYAWSFENVHSSGPITTSSFVISDTTNDSAINLRMVDLDEDGKPDIVSQNSIYRNTTVTNEIEFDNSLPSIPGVNQNWADFDLDGKTDVITTDNGNFLLISRNRSKPGTFRNGAFATFNSAIGLAKPSANGGTAVGDFDNDGQVEFATVNPGSDNLRVWRNTGGFPLSTAQFILVGDFATGDNPGRLYTADFDRDGKLDMLAYHGTGASTTLLSIFRNTSTAGSISFTRIDLTNPSATTVAAVADLDGDGKPDILTTSETGNRFSIFRNLHTSGAFTSASFAAPFNTTVTAPRGITASDLNLDGKPEIILTRAAGFLLVYENLVPSPTINITQQPVANIQACEGTNSTITSDATGASNITYQWQKFNAVLSQYDNLVNDATYSGVATKTLTIQGATTAQSGDYRCLIKGDFATDTNTTTATLTVSSPPTAPTAAAVSRCDAGPINIIATGGPNGNYRWYTTASGGTAIAGETNGTIAIASLTTTTTYYVSLATSVCESSRTAAVATVNSSPAAPSITVTGNTTLCSGQSIVLSAPTGFASYLWSTGATTQQVTVSTAGSFSVQVTNASGCTSPASGNVTVTLINCSNNQPPVINTQSYATSIGGKVSIDLISILSDPDNNLDLATLKILSQPQSGAVAQIDASNTLQIDYSNTAFSGTDRITIEICDIAGSCTSRELEIEVDGDFTIYNAVSPNGDGKNEILFLSNITVRPETRENKVTIYNRWGDLVWETENYDNDTRVFTGLNKNGKELSTGIYFYRITYPGGAEPVEGYLSLKR